MKSAECIEGICKQPQPSGIAQKGNKNNSGRRSVIGRKLCFLEWSRGWGLEGTEQSYGSG